MIDHIGLFVADAAKRADFYEKLLAPLGYVKKAAYPTAVASPTTRTATASGWNRRRTAIRSCRHTSRSAPRPPMPSRRSMRRVSRPAAPTTASPGPAPELRAGLLCRVRP